MELGVSCVLSWPGWPAAALFGLVRENRERRDILGRTRSDIRSWQPSGGVEVVRSLGSRFALAAGALLAGYAPFGGIPDPAFLGPVTREYVAPKLALQVTGGRTTKFRLRGRWQATAAAGRWTSACWSYRARRRGAGRGLS